MAFADVGLTMTYVSTFQILRGFVVVVTAVFSQASSVERYRSSIQFANILTQHRLRTQFVLGRKQQLYHWTGVLLVVIGTVVVGSVQ
eukprot:SAG31_NODE_274_length_18666_cov_72.753972_15_plen_87_part_00